MFSAPTKLIFSVAVREKMGGGYYYQVAGGGNYLGGYYLGEGHLPYLGGLFTNKNKLCEEG